MSAARGGVTVGQALQDAARALEASGHAARPRREAEELCEHVLGRSRAWLVAHAQEPLPDAARAALDEAVARRAAGEPVAYIVGWSEFHGRRFAVTRATLIPRPETEKIPELARGDRPARIADVGTGSGCLAVTLALEHPGARVVAVDLSAEALPVARANARALGADVAFARCDGLEALATSSIDLIVANPPYVDPADRPSLPVEVRDHEPAAALYSPGGTAHIAAWLTGAARVLRPPGRLLFEIGHGQADAVLALAASHPELRGVRIHPDDAGIPRVLDARRR